MNTVNISKKDLDLVSPNLSIEEIILIKIIFMNDQELFKSFARFYNVDNYLIWLEEKQFIKITDKDEGLNGIALRVKADVFLEAENQDKLIGEVIDYLNTKCQLKRGFAKVESNKRLIRGRFAEGYTVEDLKAVIDSKVAEWKNTKSEIYLRPETLFNATKFQGYIVRSGRNNIKSAFVKDV